jgi:hypothetical protein
MERVDMLPTLVFPHNLQVRDLDVVVGGVLELGDLFI